MQSHTLNAIREEQITGVELINQKPWKQTMQEDGRHRNQTKTDQHVTLPLQTLFGTVQQDELMSLSLFSTFNYFLNLMTLISR